MPPRVSVLLPTHNRADVVELAVQSVLAQTESDFELLIVADGCTDGTVALLEGLDARIRIFDLPKAPHFGYANRNVALREARGEFVALAAHDDLLCPDHLAQLLQALTASGGEWIYSRPLWVSTDGIIVPYGANLTLDDELEHFLTAGNFIPASCVVYRRSCLDRYGYWPEDVPSAADWRHWIAIIEGGGRRNLAYLPTPTCLHFSANWRASRHAAASEMRAWLEVADSASWWPAALRWPIPAGTTEQRVIAQAMRTGGAAWLRDVRSAVATVIDRVAWEDLRVVRPQLHEREAENQQLRSQADHLETELTSVRGQLSASRTLAESQVARISTLSDHIAELESVTVADAAQLATLHDDLAAHESLGQSNAIRLETAERELQVVRHRLAAMLASTSWHVTAPMRAVKQLLSGPAEPQEAPDPGRCQTPKSERREVSDTER